jgi:hypothetical protein
MMTTKRIGLFLSGQAGVVQFSQDNFLVRGSKLRFHSEARFYLFGEPLRVRFKNQFHEKYKPNPCEAPNNFASRLLGSFINGLYVTPGFIYQNQGLQYWASENNDVLIKSFNYNIKNKGATLAIGCQMHFWNLTLGAGWGIQITKPHWSGPVDIFGDDFYTTTYPWELNIRQAPRFEVGINFLGQSPFKVK